MEDKKKIPLPLIVLLVGVAIGVVFSGIGLYKQLDSKRINKERYEQAYKQSQAKVDAANKRIADIKEELAPLKEQYENKKQECDSMKMSDANWFSNHSKCQREASNIDSQIDKLENEEWQLENDSYTVYYDLVKPMSYQIFYIIGGAIAGLAALGAFIIYLVKGKKTY